MTSLSMHDRQDSAAGSGEIQDPPRTLFATLLRLGPGMIIAGSIVGSGELIATTNVGAEAGFWLLWLVIIGCVIKVFAQVELGRHTLVHRETPLAALNAVPGPRWIVNWFTWYWALVVVLVITQQGGIVGCVGQALSISFPLTTAGREFNQLQNDLVRGKIELALFEKQRSEALPSDSGLDPSMTANDHSLSGAEGVEESKLVMQLDGARQQFEQHMDRHGEPLDPYLWATVLAVITSVLLYVGRYNLIQWMSTIFVVLFTIVTIATTLLLQTTDTWRITMSDLMHGMSFRLPPQGPTGGYEALGTALMTFGIIGVGAVELITYPYWCLEKGYARFTGVRDGSAAWIQRARGWLRVMQWDAWASMIVYTTATIAFYLLGAAVLHRVHLVPGGRDMIRTLSEMYVPIFGPWTQSVFLIGTFAVLYSTFFVAAAGMARLVADSLGLFHLTDGSEQQRLRWTVRISVVWPLLSVALYWLIGWYLQGQSPKVMVLASGAGQAIMLPMIGVAVLYFRYRRGDENLKPGRLWDLLLWISVAGFVLAAAGTIHHLYQKIVVGG